MSNLIKLDNKFFLNIMIVLIKLEEILKKAVFFDMDGTLLDTEKLYCESYIRAFSEFGIEFTKDDYKEYAGKTLLENLRSNYKRTNDEVLAEKIAKRAAAIMTDLEKTKGADLKPGCLETLNALKDAKIKMYISSSTIRKIVTRTLKGAGLYDFFDGMVCGDEVENSKPAPDIFLKTLALSEFKKEDAIIIEDSLAGVEAGYNSGIDVIMVPDIVKPNAETKKQAFKILKSLDEILEFII